MNYQNFLPFAVVLLPLLKKSKGSLSVLPIPKGSYAYNLVEGKKNQGVQVSNLLWGKKIYEEFYKDKMPKELFVTISDLGGSGSNENAPQLLDPETIKMKRFQSVPNLLWWYPEIMKKYAFDLYASENMFRCIPENFPSMDLPHVYTLTIDSTASENPSLLTKRTFDQLKKIDYHPFRLEDDEESIHDYTLDHLNIFAKPSDISHIIQSLPDKLDNLKTFYLKIYAEPHEHFTVNVQDLRKLFSYKKIASSRRSSSIQIEGFLSRMVFNSTRSEFYNYMMMSGVKPESLKSIFDNNVDFIFNDSELRRF